MKTYLTVNHLRLAGKASEIRNQLGMLTAHPIVSHMSLLQYLSAVSIQHGSKPHRRYKG